MKELSLFSGIGAFEKAQKNMGIQYELIGFSEIDKYAVKSYCAIHDVDESMNLGDITKIDEKTLPKDIDLITYGFPCQDISLAGKQKGLFNEDGSQTRSGLFFEALRIIEETKPRVAIAENVKNLTSKKFNAQFQIVLESLEQAGYNNYWQVLNAKDYGIPQNRERVFIVSIRKDIDTGCFQFPEGFPLELRLKDMLEEVVEEQFYIDNSKVKQFVLNNPQIDFSKPVLGTRHKRNDLSFATRDRVYNTEKESPTLTSTMYKDSPKILQIAQMYPNSGNPQAGRIYDAEGISPAMDTCSGGNRMPKIVVSEPTIQRVDIPQTVKVRKYPVDCKMLCECLRNHKSIQRISNKDIAESLDVPLTKVEHWFRRDDCFSIPDSEVWMQLKALLKIETDEFDESIMTFEEKEGVFEKSERHYFSEGIAPTLTSATAAEKIIEPSLKIRKLTPKECFRLMGFSDEDFEKAEAVNSNTQLYKQAGNSIVVPVLEHIFKALIACGALEKESEEKEMKLDIKPYNPVEQILFNYEELKTEIQAKAETYKTLVYTDENIKEAKADKAALNKLKKALNDERIRLEREFMQPFNDFKTKINEIISIIDEPIGIIDKQIKEVDEQKKAEKLNQIQAYWNNVTSPDHPLTLQRVMNPKWLNATTSMKSVQDEINGILAKYAEDIATLQNLPEFSFEAIETYKTTLDLRNAMNEAHRLSEMAKRKAEAERLAAERKAAEEAKKAEEIPCTPYKEPVATVTATANINGESVPVASVQVETPQRMWVSFQAYLTNEDAYALADFFKARNIEYKPI